MSFLPEGPGASGRLRQRISKGSENEINACFTRNVKPLQTNTNLFSERIKEAHLFKEQGPFPQ